MAINMSNNEKVKELCDGVLLFVQEVAYFQAITDGYDATDFCQGIQFGIHGSKLVIAGGKHMLRDLPGMQWSDTNAHTF